LSTPLDILKKYWGYDSFRGQQEAIIHAVLEGKDVLALLPTGGGKSVCFQVPALLSDGLCIVITPLIALMKDQVESLQQKGIAAFAIHSGLSNEEVVSALDNAANGAYTFLYISPERIETAAFQNIVTDLKVSLIAVDEAHCISQWGYDFRPPYLRIVQLRQYFPHAPVVALTASATPIVQKDIIEKLSFKNDAVFQQSFQRNNLSFSVKACENKFDRLAKILSHQNGSAIVYCKTRRQTQDVSRLLNIQDMNADFYHAGLSQEERDAKQRSWMQNETRVIVCTNAFGMGINKPNVRLVVHYDTPDCIENYYQEAGRAGRDGVAANAILLYHPRDIKELEQLPDVRFPNFDTIKKTYRHLCDFLQIPVGLGEGNFYDFDLNTFVKNFQLNVLQTIYSIKALEQAGLIIFNESIFLPSKVNFTIDKDSLYDFENNYPQYEPLIKYLLRNYEGIFSYRVSVFEKRTAQILRVSNEAVMQQLQALQQYGVLQYLPQKETPQLFFCANRAATDFLSFNHSDYLKRKKIFINRVEKMLQYIHTKTCRSVFMAQYFGDENAQQCGVCDNCSVVEKEEKISSTAFKNLSTEILNLLKNKSSSVKNISSELNHFPPEKIRETLRHLQSERKIKMDMLGNVSLI